jgi:hypothetical protein
VTVIKNKRKKNRGEKIMLINVLVLISTVFGFMSLYYGFRNWVLIKSNKLWNASWAAFISTATLIGIRRLYSFQYEHEHMLIEYLLVLAISIGAFTFALTKNKFFEKYLRDIREEKADKNFRRKEELIKTKEEGREEANIEREKGRETEIQAQEKDREDKKERITMRRSKREQESTDRGIAREEESITREKERMQEREERLTERKRNIKDKNDL